MFFEPNLDKPHPVPKGLILAGQLHEPAGARLLGRRRVVVEHRVVPAVRRAVRLRRVLLRRPLHQRRCRVPAVVRRRHALYSRLNVDKLNLFLFF